MVRGAIDEIAPQIFADLRTGVWQPEYIVPSQISARGRCRAGNARQIDGRVHFATQVSIDAAGDIELLQMCANAGLTSVFIGIKTPNEDSLRESKKRQNLKKNLIDGIQRFIDYGIAVECGMIVGFDSEEFSVANMSLPWRRQFQYSA
jgi:hypothetical protein